MSATKRASLSPKLREIMWSRPESRYCAYCAAPAEEIDHVEPWSVVRIHHTDNLLPACKQCNDDKANRPLVVFLALSHHVEPEGVVMLKPDLSKVSVENHGKVRQLFAAIVRFLDSITPPFLEPESIDDEIAWLYSSNTSPVFRELSDDDYLVLANDVAERIAARPTTQETPCTTNKPSPAQDQ